MSQANFSKWNYWVYIINASTHLQLLGPVICLALSLPLLLSLCAHMGTIWVISEWFLVRIETVFAWNAHSWMSLQTFFFGLQTKCNISISWNGTKPCAANAKKLKLKKSELLWTIVITQLSFFVWAYGYSASLQICTALKTVVQLFMPWMAPKPQKNTIFIFLFSLVRFRYHCFFFCLPSIGHDSRRKTGDSGGR